LLLWLELLLLLWFDAALCMRLSVRRFETARARHHSIGLPSIFRSTRFSRLIAFRFCTARARHHSIGLPSIIRSRGSAARPAGRWRDAAGASVIGATLASPSFD
jgi:hypothetical protein